MRKAIIVIGSIWFIQISVLAQQEPDSLELLIRSKEGTDKIDLINRIANQYIDRDTDLSRRLSEEAYHLSETTNYMPGKAEAAKLLGMINYFDGFLNQAEYYCKIAQGLSASLKDYRLEREANTTLALVFEEQKEFDRSIELFNRNAALDAAKPDPLDLAIDLQNLGRVNEKSNHPGLALECYMKAASLFKKGDYEEYLVKIFDSIGKLYLRTNPDSARQYLFRSFELYLTRSDMSGYYDLFWDLSDYYLKKNMPESSRYYLQAARQKILKEGNDNLLLTDYQKLMEVFENIGDFREAYQARKQYDSLKDSLSSGGIQPDITDHIQKLEKENKEMAAELLHKEAQLNEGQWLSRGVLFYMITGGIFLIIFVSVAFYYRYKLFRKSIASADKLKENIITLSAELKDKNAIIEQLNKNEEKNVHKIRILSSVIGQSEVRTPERSEKWIIEELKALAAETGADTAGLFIYNEYQQLVSLGEFDAKSGRLSSDDKIGVADNPVYWQALKSNDYLVSENCKNDPRYAELTGSRFQSDEKISRIDFPIRVEQKLLGNLFLERKGREGSWSDQTKVFIEDAAIRWMPRLGGILNNQIEKSGEAEDELKIPEFLYGFDLIMMEKDADGLILRMIPEKPVNPAFSLAGLVGKNWVDRLEKQDQDNLSTYYHSLQPGMIKDELINYECHLEDGRKAQVAEKILQVNRVKDKNGILSALRFSPVTELVHELKLQVNSLRAVLSSLNNGVLVCNNSRTIVMVNPAVEKIAGYSSEELMGRPLENLVRTHSLDFENTNRDGMPKPVLIQAKNKTGIHVLAYLRSFLTGRDRYYILEFFSPENKPREKGAAIPGDPGYHIIDSNIFSWYTFYRLQFYRFLLDNLHYPVPSEFEELIDHLHRETMLANNQDMYEKFIDLSGRLRASLQSIIQESGMDWVSGIFGVGDMNEYEIDPLCKWLLERIFSSEEKIISHLELNFHNRLSCDLSLLAFAIFQILMNGKESMKGGGDIYIKTFGDHGNYNLIITDTGEGFSPEIRKKLFTGPVSTKPGCMGYGLYFVKMILGALNGNIHFRSHLNRGTEVSVIIPLIS